MSVSNAQRSVMRSKPRKYPGLLALPRIALRIMLPHSSPRRPAIRPDTPDLSRGQDHCKLRSSQSEPLAALGSDGRSAPRISHDYAKWFSCEISYSQ